MTRIPFISKQIKSAGYDSDRRELEVQFHSGEIYTYHDVTQRAAEGLWKAPSAGKYFHQFIRNQHKFTKHDSP